MAKAKVWKGVRVSMQSAIATAVVITGISNASAAVVLTSTPPTTGLTVRIDAPGMPQVNGRLFRVGTVVASTSFTLDGEDSTLYDVFSGTATFQVVTLGTPITSATTVSASGGDFPFISTTTIHDTQQSQIPGLPNPLTYSLDHIEDASDAGQQALLAAANLTVERGFRFTFLDGSFFLFNAYVGFSGAPTGQAQALVTTPSALTVTKRITKYAI